MIDLKQLQSPMYHIPERKHNFEDNFREAPPEIRDLVGPVYELERTHHFNEIDKTLTDLKSLAGKKKISLFLNIYIFYLWIHFFPHFLQAHVMR